MRAPDRFLGRAGVYAAARPSYPPALGEWMSERGLLLGPVADIGAGTGLFTRLLLSRGAGVHAIEPNPEMRARLEEALRPELESGRLSVVDGTSEATGLPSASVALITAAQAAHWFAPEPTLREFGRILCPGGLVLLVWNDWRGEDVPFNLAYGEVVRRFQSGMPEAVSRAPSPELAQLLPGGFEHVAFGNPLTLTRERLHALAASVSYLPSPTSPDFPALARALDGVFGLHQEDGTVTLHYRAHAYLGRPS
ncbi:methyltransferase, FkbM family [Deinococcus hopiensis KR-140]|uniref:Methyltransferase, FkbM family n=2 Tax=Deinococcus TaxID=1298 RepID=A0A1W1VG93_9DEIO|nr:methyltransferase, FkbM family [Deinococcus hopiensis KR-140]